MADQTGFEIEQDNATGDRNRGNEQSSRAENNGSGSAFPQFAVDAANRRLGQVGATLTGAADAIEGLAGRDNAPFGQQFQGLASGAASRLRTIGDTINEQDAGELIGNLQRSAAARPGVAVAIGAAVGAGLAVALIQTAPDRAGSRNNAGRSAK